MHRCNVASCYKVHAHLNYLGQFLFNCLLYYCISLQGAKLSSIQTPLRPKLGALYTLYDVQSLTVTGLEFTKILSDLRLKIQC